MAEVLEVAAAITTKRSFSSSWMESIPQNDNVEVFSVEDFKNAGYSLSNVIRLNSNNNPYLRAVDTTTNKVGALYLSLGLQAQLLSITKEELMSQKELGAVDYKSILGLKLSANDISIVIIAGEDGNENCIISRNGNGASSEEWF